MKRLLLPWAACACMAMPGQAQSDVDTVVNVYRLGDLVIHGRAEGLDLEGFMRQVKADTSFLHAFLNMRHWPHVVEGRLQVRHKGEKELAAQFRRARLLRRGPMAELHTDSVAENGKLRDRKGGMRYLTAELYEDLFWPTGSWRTDNTVATYRQGMRGKGRLERYKEELKKFMFNPGEEIASVPFIGDKLALFDPRMTPWYGYTIAQGFRNGRACWEFSALAKDSLNGRRADPDATVIKTMHTWFDQQDMQVIAREYRIVHASLPLDFDIRIRVDNTLVGQELVPTVIQYDGDWDIPLHKREQVRFQLLLKDWSTRVAGE